MNEPEKPKRGRPKTLDVDKTLDVAMQAYWREDPLSVSLNAICAMADVSKPALYREFGSEDALMRAVLDRYAESVLSGTFDVLAKGAPLAETLEAMIAYAADDPQMEPGCLFYKMRAARHRLGELTRSRVDEIDAAAVTAYEAYLETQRQSGHWRSDQPIDVVARYLVEQIGLALTQRAAGMDSGQIRASLELALSAIQRT